MSGSDGRERIAAAFAGARERGQRAALMPYMMGGYPDLETSRRIGLAYVESGADLIELGVPFSDPLADGPVIHAAGTAALAAGIQFSDVMALADELSDRVPVVLMCYSNPILARGPDAFAARAAAAGVAGLIVPDLPLDEAPEVASAARAAGLATVPLIAPTTGEDRLRRIGAAAEGFLYAVSLTGTTGERTGLAGIEGLVARAAAATDVPVAVGFGIGSPEQAREVADAGADGVIIGSRLVRAAGVRVDPEGEVRALVSSFAAALG